MKQNMTAEQVNAALSRKRAWGKAQKILANVFIYFVLLLMYATLIYITVFSFTTHKTTGEWGGFSFQNYTTLFDSNNQIAINIWSAAGNTALVAIVSATLSTILGTLGAIGAFYSKRRTRIKR